MTTEIKEKELLEKYKKQLEEQQKKRETEMQLDLMVSKLFEPKARERLSNVKLVNKELYLMVASQITRLYLSGKLSSKIGEQTLKGILLRLQPKKRDIRIKRK